MPYIEHSVAIHLPEGDFMPSETVVHSKNNTRVENPSHGRFGSVGIDYNVCTTCFHRSHCLTQALDVNEFSVYSSLVSQSKHLSKGDYLFRQSEAFEALFVVLSGSVKTCRLDADGDEQIVGFHLPGDLMALDSIGSGLHPSSGVVLEDCAVCKIPCRVFDDGTPGAEHLRLELVHQTARSLQAEYLHTVVLRKNSADQRLAMFLFDLSCRLENRNYAYDLFDLSLSRQDIGNYLGLALETVSRSFSHLQDKGVITVHHRHITVHNRDELEFLAWGAAGLDTNNMRTDQSTIGCIQH